MDLTEARLLPRRGSGLQVHPIRASCLLSLLVMLSSINVRMQVAGQAWKGPSSPLWKLCCSICVTLSVWGSLVWPSPGESPHRCGSLGQLLFTPAHSSHPKGTLCPNSSICLCILPGFMLAFVPAPFRLQGSEGKAVVCVSSSSYFPKWCDLSAKSTAPETERRCLFKSISTACGWQATDNWLGFPVPWFLHL